jgi:creatinine amidohydrolase
LLANSAPVTFLPIERIGISSEHTDFPGTLTLSPETAIRNWMALGESVARAGLRKLVIVTSHGGNSAAMSIVAQELRAHLHMLVVTTSWGRLSAADTLFPAEEIEHGIHGGAIETSIMLARYGAQVKRKAIADFRPITIAMKKNFRWLSSQRPAPFAWQTQDLHPSGAVGDATLATPEKGEQLIDQGAQAFCELLDDVERFDLQLLSNRPKT